MSEFYVTTSQNSVILSSVLAVLTRFYGSSMARGDWQKADKNLFLNALADEEEDVIICCHSYVCLSVLWSVWKWLNIPYCPTFLLATQS